MTQFVSDRGDTEFAPPKSGQDFDGFMASINAMKRASGAMQEFCRVAPIKPIAIPRVSLLEVLGIGTLRLRVGRWFIDKHRARLQEAGPRKAAAQMRKQGIPLEIALLALLGCEERFTHLRGAA